MDTQQQAQGGTGQIQEDAGERRVVALAVDNSKHAAYAFDYYVNELRRENDFVLIVHAPEVYDLTDANPSTVSRVLSQLKNETEELTKNYTEKMLSAGITHGKIRTGHGRPGEVICKIIHEEKASMVVTGTRGRGLISRTVLGSVSHYVINHAHIPVVVCQIPK